MQGNNGKSDTQTLAWPRTKISRNKPDGMVATSWKQQVQTAKIITNKKPAITIRDNE